MALKDKLMTLEDFKAVRDVDVASNSAQFTEIKADLGALENNVFSVDAKYALAELLKNVISTDKNAKQLYENLINTMGVDMLKENVFIYLPNQFGDLSLVQGSLVLESIGGVKHGLGINNNANMSSKYRVFGVSNGKSESQKYMGYQDESLFNLYPIPVPENATSAWIGVFPSSRYIISRLMRWDETNSSYVVVESENQRTEGNHIKTFSRGKNMFLALMSAYNGANSAYADGPDAVVVVFKE